jgi:hypothetical protein
MDEKLKLRAKLTAKKIEILALIAKKLHGVTALSEVSSNDYEPAGAFFCGVLSQSTHGDRAFSN